MVSAVSSADGVGRLVMGFFPFLEPDFPRCSPPARRDNNVSKPLVLGALAQNDWMELLSLLCSYELGLSSRLLRLGICGQNF
eukprot:scaffold534122_cov39-Prasinocladus_malaysianus.AAC.1